VTAKMAEWTEFIKSVVRPFIIVWGCFVYGVCVMTSKEVPALLAGLVSVVIVEYFGERAVIRFREKAGDGDGGTDENTE
jgi:hypothetical protein